MAKKLLLIMVCLLSIGLTACDIDLFEDDLPATVRVWNKCAWNVNLYFISDDDTRSVYVGKGTSSSVELEADVSYIVKLTSPFDSSVTFSGTYNFDSGSHYLILEWVSERDAYLLSKRY